MMAENKQHDEPGGVELIEELFEGDTSEPAPKKPAAPRKPRKPRTRKAVVVEDTVTTTSVDDEVAAVEETIVAAEVEVPEEATTEEVYETVTAAVEAPEVAVDPESVALAAEPVTEAGESSSTEGVAAADVPTGASDSEHAATEDTHVGGGAGNSSNPPADPPIANIFNGKTKSPWLMTAVIANSLSILSLFIWFIPGTLAVIVGFVASIVALRKKEVPRSWAKGNFIYSLVVLAFHALVWLALIAVLAFAFFAAIIGAAVHQSPYYYR